MIDQKYEMTDEVRTMNGGQAVRRIRFLRDGLWGPAGTLGGYLQSEENLSQSMDCYVSDEAVVMGDAEVSGNAVVRDQAVVRGQAMVTGWGHVVGDAVVQLLGGTGAHLAHRELDPRRLLARGHPVGVEAVLVPGQVNAGRVLVTPAASAADWGFTPACGPQDQSAGMF